MKRPWLVTYSTPQHDQSQIVIWADEKSEVRQILKKHLGNMKFRIERVTERSVVDERE